MIFFPVVIVIYFVIPAKIRKYWLLIASYYFYMSWNAKYAVLIGGSTVITYLCGLIVGSSSPKLTVAKKKFTLVTCIVINLGILGLFKYWDFAIETICSFLGLFHITVAPHQFNHFLPVGISFYTFQALGYIIDVYREDTPVEKDFIRYALFVSFFPQLVAGLIERSKNLLRQMNDIENLKLWNARRVASGAILMVWGLFMKMVIADRTSLLVDLVFDHYHMSIRELTE